MRGWLLLACLLHTAVCPHANAAARTGGADTLTIYRHLRDSATAFHGPAIGSSDTGVILLGVLAPLSHVAGRELLAAVQLAVDQANGDGGIGGRECQLCHPTARIP